MQHSISLEIQVNAHKYYHVYNKDYYHNFDNNEKQKLWKYLNSKSYLKHIPVLIGGGHQTFTISDIKFLEKNIAGINRLHMLVSIESVDFTKLKIKREFKHNTPQFLFNEIMGNLNHYYRAGEHKFGHIIYYSRNNNIKELGSFVVNYSDYDEMDEKMVHTTIYKYDNRIKNSTMGNYSVNLSPSINAVINGQIFSSFDY